ncbi:MAG: hypothetical protein HY288_03035 [Planctomycetia bacterium]|nr:hypothetical protein [Planctomycetia bacterium]
MQDNVRHLLVAAMRVYAVDRSNLPPLEMPPRFRRDIHYFMAVPGADEGPGEPRIPKLPPDEYWIRLEDARRWLDEGILMLVSPLDSENQAEVEISEDQEKWLQWLLDNQVQHVRLGP